MIIIHNYSPIYTKKLIELGMAKKGDGFKITQHFCTKPEMLFNVVAQPGGELYDIVKNYASCFYVDRLQGGTYFSDYPFSPELMQEYDRLTGGHFLGVQLHELGETRFYDWRRIKNEMDKNGLPWTEKNIYDSIRAISHNKQFPHFSQGSAGEYAAATYPETMSAYYADLDSVIKSRMARFGGRIVNCDAGGMYPGLERENDMPLSWAEIGGLTPNTNYQIALRRGMSRAMGKPWGTYPEPWGVDGGVSAYCFMENRKNEWFESSADFEFQTDGEKGGTSMSLARRMMYYSLFAGADYFAEEYGQCNTFYNYETFRLSPYGVIKRDFFALSRRLKHVRPIVPIAVVVPHEFKLLNHQFEYPFENDVRVPSYHTLFGKITKLFGDGGKQFGFEDIYFGTSAAGSLCDVIYDDSYVGNPPYDLVIDYSHRLSGENVIDADAADLKVRVAAFAAERLPIMVESPRQVDVQLFENDGDKFVCLYNHRGITKNVQTGEVANSDAELALHVSVKDGRIAEVLNVCDCRYELNDAATVLDVALPAGTFIVLRYV